MSNVIIYFKPKYDQSVSFKKLYNDLKFSLEMAGDNAMNEVLDLAVSTVPFNTGDLMDSGDCYGTDVNNDVYKVVVEFEDRWHLETDVPLEGEKHTAGLDSPITSWADTDTVEDMYIQNGDKHYLSNSFNATPVFDLICREFSHTFFK